MRKLLRKHGKTPRVMVADKLKSYAAANRKLGLKFEHHQHKGLNNRAENSHQPTRAQEKVMRRFKSAYHFSDFCRFLTMWLTSSCNAATTAMPTRSGNCEPRRLLPGIN